MPVCNQNMTDLDVMHVQSEPGMAHFAGTGPRGKTCGNCIFWGYSTTRKRVNKSTGEVREVTTRREGCKNYYIITNKHGPKISPKLLSCKYFKDNDNNKDIGK